MHATGNLPPDQSLEPLLGVQFLHCLLRRHPLDEISRSFGTAAGLLLAGLLFLFHEDGPSFP